MIHQRLQKNQHPTNPFYFLLDLVESKQICGLITCLLQLSRPIYPHHPLMTINRKPPRTLNPNPPR